MLTIVVKIHTIQITLISIAILVPLFDLDVESKEVGFKIPPAYG